MNEQNLSKRLQIVASYVPFHSRLADIGSDHGYLPTALLLEKKIIFGVAGEVALGPYQSTLNQVERMDAKESISVRLGDGLSVIENDDEITVCTICGMGGSLIAQILDAGWQTGKLATIERLILQPNVNAELVRSWLMKHGYQITFEEIIKEDEKIYEILVGEKGAASVEYTEKELLFGVKLSFADPVFQEKWQREKEQKKRILSQLKKASSNQKQKMQQIETEIQMIEEVLKT